MVETFQSRWYIIISCIVLDILGTQGWVMTHIKTNQVESLEVSFNRGFISFLEKSCILSIYIYIYIYLFLDMCSGFYIHGPPNFRNMYRMFSFHRTLWKSDKCVWEQILIQWYSATSTTKNGWAPIFFVSMHVWNMSWRIWVKDQNPWSETVQKVCDLRCQPRSLAGQWVSKRNYGGSLKQKL